MFIVIPRNIPGSPMFIPRILKNIPRDLVGAGWGGGPGGVWKGGEKGCRCVCVAGVCGWS